MITKLNNGVTHLKLGDGTLYSGVAKTDDGIPIGIMFTPNKNSYKDGVFFQITSLEGVTGYIRPLIGLVEEMIKHSDDDEKENSLKEIAKFKAVIEPFMPVEKGAK